jgi:hypothetical protein
VRLLFVLEDSFHQIAGHANVERMTSAGNNVREIVSFVHGENVSQIIRNGKQSSWICHPERSAAKSKDLRLLLGCSSSCSVDSNRQNINVQSQNGVMICQEEEMAEDHIRFEKVDYKRLTAKQKELFNFQKIAATLADFGYNCIKLADDWQGADFLAYHKDGTTTLKVQLKSRLTIDKKYSKKGIWIAFPYNRDWYFIEHDSLVEKVGKHTTWLNSDSWKKDKGGYSSTSVNSELLASLIKSNNRLGPVYISVLFDDVETFDPAR